jgi:hypothetical protein
MIYLERTPWNFVPTRGWLDPQLIRRQGTKWTLKIPQVIQFNFILRTAENSPVVDLMSMRNDKKFIIL